MEKKKTISRPLLIVSSVFIAVLIFLCIAAGLIFSKPAQEFSNAPVNTDQISSKLLEAALTGKSVTFKPEEASAVLTPFAQNLAQKHSVQADSLRCAIQPDNSVSFQLPVYYHGKTLYLTTNTNVRYENQSLSVEVLSAYVGRFPVSPSWAAQAIGDVSDQIKTEGHIVSLPAKLFEQSFLQGTVSIQLQTLSVSKEGFVLGIHTDVEVLKKKLSENLASLLGKS